MRILIADDDPATRAVVRRVIMRHFPFEVAEAENGLDALEKLATAPFRLLLLDVKMPVMSGMDTLRVMRGNAATADLPVLVMTGSTDEQEVREAVSLGVSDYVLKPVRPAVLVERVARLVSGLAPPRQTPPPRTRSAGVPVRLLPTSRVLLVDGHADFRQVFREVIGDSAHYAEVGSGVEALRRCLVEPPSCVFIGSGIGLLRAEDLARALRHLPGGNRLALVRVLPPGAAAKRRGHDGFDGVIRHSFAPAVLRDAIDDLGKEGGPSPDVLLALPNLRLMLLAATEEVAGRALGAAIQVREAPARGAAAGVEAVARLALSRPGVPALLVAVAVSHRSTAELTERFCKADPAQATPGESTTGLVGVTALLAERLAVALTEAGVEAAVAPGIAVEPATAQDRMDHALSLRVQTRPGGLTLRVTIQAEVTGCSAAA